MVFKIDFLDDGVYEWAVTPEGGTASRIEGYTPSIYVTSERSGDGSFDAVRELLRPHPAVVEFERERWRRGFRYDAEDVLRIDLESIDVIRPVARRVAELDRPGTYRCYNVDLSREFRYCLECDRDPTPARELTTLELAVEPVALATPPVTELTIGADQITGDAISVLEAVDDAVSAVDPDVLICSTAELVPTLYETAAEYDLDVQLGRRPGWQRLAGRSTYESYGQVGHSPARYNLPGRVLIDRSNTFFYRQSGLEGCLDLVQRSGKPLQELSWASIGNVLTAIQIREARDRTVLVPWRSWRHEFFKPLSTLHDADRGGHTVAPEVGVHEHVHELDFSSLYPNIIRTRNVSPETIRCSCHAERADVPELGYSICDEQGYLPAVLGPLIDDRDEMKAQLRGGIDDADRERAIRRRSEAIKWILVSCFGYQGFANAKFGRIECHEAINAFARTLLLDAKEHLEANGWHLVHGIVDSLWVTPVDGERQTPLEQLVAEITDVTEIRLEYEAAYDWIAFVPLRDGEEGALNKYFGKRADEDRYKYRGIECRQRHTPSFVADAQRDLIATLDDHRTPQAVCDRLQRHLETIRSGSVEPASLVITRRVSKHLEQYHQRTRTVAALERARDADLEYYPGERLSYVVVDDEADSRDRVALEHEAITNYDADFYAELLLRAAESVCSPLGWRRPDIERYLADRVDASLTAWR